MSGNISESHGGIRISPEGLSNASGDRPRKYAFDLLAIRNGIVLNLLSSRLSPSLPKQIPPRLNDFSPLQRVTGPINRLVAADLRHPSEWSEHHPCPELKVMRI